MSTRCTLCGYELEAGNPNCPACGTKVPVPDHIQTEPVAPPVYNQWPVAPQSAEPTPTGGKFGVVGMGAYFGLILLYSLPVIGFIACIIMSFAPQNRNIRNFARATLVWMIIGLIIMGLLTFAIYCFVFTAIDYINQEVGGELGQMIEDLNSLNELLDQYGGIEGFEEQYGDLDGLLDQYANSGLETIPIG